MAFDVTMPKLTDSMEEGRIVRWRVAEGDRVREGDVLAEIETDKAVMELECFRSGTVAELARREGDVAGVGEVIARVADEGQASSFRGRGAGAETAPEPPAARVSAPVPEAREAEPLAPGAPGLSGPGSPASGAADFGPDVPLPGARPLAARGGVHSPRPAPPPRGSDAPVLGGAAASVRASPRARRLARERGLDLAGLQGSGPGGRITAADVEAAPAGPATRGGAAAADRGGEELPPVSFSEGEAVAEELSLFQRAAVRRVTASKRWIPHFYVEATVRAEALRKRREAAGEGVTVTHLLLRACCLALEAFPEANRSYDRGRWLRWKGINLGLAIQTDLGLVVGVLRGAQGRDLAWIAERTRSLVDRAREGRLGQEERTNATFTLSSLGALGVESFSAILNPPSALTLAVGAILPAPVVEGDRVVPGSVLRLTLSCDHRAVDGVLAARFLGEVKTLLENPAAL